MNQENIFAEIERNTPRCVVPKPDTQNGVLLRALQRGEKLTVALALTKYGVYALSQRMGELKRMGWPVQSRTITTPFDRRIAEYSMP